jgi:hypothetical protein
MRSTVDLTYIAIWAIVRLLRIESLQREENGSQGVGFSGTFERAAVWQQKSVK